MKMKSRTDEKRSKMLHKNRYFSSSEIFQSDRFYGLSYLNYCTMSKKMFQLDFCQFYLSTARSSTHPNYVSCNAANTDLRYSQISKLIMLLVLHR